MNIKPLALFVLLIFFLPHAGAQPAHGHSGVFAFAENEAGAMASKVLSGLELSTARQRACQRVFDQLVQARGVLNVPRPKLVIANSLRTVAWAKPQEAEVGIEEKAIDVCFSFGADSLNALAALLAHELTHYYEKHGWVSKFAADNEEVAGNNKLVSANDRTRWETEADYLGGFLAYSAGFNTSGIMPVLLERIYQAYAPHGLKKEMPGYPPLGDRIRIAENSLDKLMRLIHLFEGANYLIGLGQYDFAKRYFDFVLGDYQSRELHNNMGVLKVQLALQFFSDEELPYVFPVELDLESRFKTSLRSSMADRIVRREALLKEAIQSFQAAQALDENYPAALLNLGCAYALLGKDRMGKLYGEMVLEVAEGQEMEKTKGDAIILLGLLEARAGDAAAARATLQKASGSSPKLARRNMELMKGEVISTGAATALAPAGSAALNTGPDINELINQMHFDDFTPDFYIQVDTPTIFLYKETGETQTMITWSDFGEEHIFLVLTKQGSAARTEEGIGVGASSAEVYKQYGAPTQTIALTNGTMLAYSDRNLLVVLDAADKVKKIGIVRVKRQG